MIKFWFLRLKKKRLKLWGRIWFSKMKQTPIEFQIVRRLSKVGHRPWLSISLLWQIQKGVWMKTSRNIFQRTWERTLALRKISSIRKFQTFYDSKELCSKMIWRIFFLAKRWKVWRAKFINRSQRAFKGSWFHISTILLF